MILRHTLQSGLGPGPVPSEKVDPGPLEKMDLMPKFTTFVKETVLLNTRVLMSNMTIAFLKF